MFIIAWVLIIGLLFVFFQFQQQASVTRSEEIIHGKLVLTADRQGHYLVKGRINDVPVDLLVDTGATMVAISKPLADKMNLSGRYPITMNTAGGSVKGYLTRIDSLTFGNFQFSNIKAVIMQQSSDELVLLGMNVLSEFKIHQENNKLILER
jgi:aspartyl protease family protein